MPKLLYGLIDFQIQTFSKAAKLLDCVTILEKTIRQKFTLQKVLKVN